MSFFAITLLAIIQGITEFLPVSSQAHLIFIPTLLGWEEHGRFLDVAIHLGTLLAVLIYFYKELWTLFMEGFLPLIKGKLTAQGLLILYLIIGTFPSIGIGYFIHTIFGDGLRGISVIAWTSIVFGILLYFVDLHMPQSKKLRNMTYLQALLIGCAQVLSFLPGASRSGTTITMARFLGFTREDATRFSFLLSIPVVMGALVLTGLSVLQESGASIFNGVLFWGVLISFLSGITAISFLMHWIKHHSYAPFMIYRILLGVGLVFWSIFS